MEQKSQWYRTVKGWVLTAMGWILWALDYWGRGKEALEIYRDLPPWAITLSPWLTPVFFLAALGFFEVQRRSSLATDASFLRKGRKKNLPQRRLKVSTVIYVGFILAMLIGSIWLVVQPNMKTEVGHLLIGDVNERMNPTAAITVDARITNIGPPSTAHDWRLEMRLEEGERAEARVVPQGTRANLLGPQGEVIDLHEQRLDELMQSPVETGGMVTGYLVFLFPGYRREIVDRPGTVLTLKFKDAADHEYSVEFKVPARVRVFVH